MGDWLDLNNKVVIVTGGSSGIGKAIAESLLENQAKVVIADLQPLAEELKDEERLLFVKTNIADRASVQELVNQTIEKFGKIDALVNNAGINLPRLLVDYNADNGKYELSDEVFEKMVNINQKGVYICSQLVAKHLIAEKNEGVIINMSSESGLEGSEGQSCYAATKAALYSFTRSWSKELGKHGIRVVGVAPGILEKTGLRTPEYEEALAYTRNITVDQLRQGYTKNSIPIGRDGKLHEVSDFVSYLISKRASYITGVTYNIAGGKTRG